MPERIPKPVSASKTVFTKPMLPSDANPSGKEAGHANPRVSIGSVARMGFEPLSLFPKGMRSREAAKTQTYGG